MFAFFIFPLVVSATFAVISLLHSVSQMVERCLLIDSSTSADVLKSVSSCLTDSREPMSVCVTEHVEKNWKYSHLRDLIYNILPRRPKKYFKADRIVVNNLLIIVDNSPDNLLSLFDCLQFYFLSLYMQLMLPKLFCQQKYF